MNVTELDAFDGGILRLGNGAVEGEVRRPLVALFNNALVIFLRHQVTDLFIRQWALAGSNGVDDLSGDFT